MKKNQQGGLIFLGLAITLILIPFSLIKNLTVSPLPLLRAAEWKIYDYQLRSLPKDKEGSPIVIVTIDDSTLELLGRWPWDRKHIAHFIDKFPATVKFIGFNIVFSEENPSDPILAKAMEKNKKTVLGYFSLFEEKQRSSRNLEAPQRSRVSAIMASDEVALVGVPKAKAFLVSTSQFQKATLAQGFLDTLIDEDGVIRRTPSLINHQGDLFPSFPLQLAHLAQNANITVTTQGGGLQYIRMGDQKIPVDRSGNFLIRYNTGISPFTTVSFRQVLEGKVPPELFSNKIVLVGVTAKGIAEEQTTPLGTVIPTLYLNAHILNSLLSGHFISPVSSLPILEVGILLLLFFILVLAFRYLKALGASLISLLLLFILFKGGDFFVRHGTWIPAFFPLAQVLILYVAFSAYEYFIEEKRTREVRQAFEHYVSPAVVEEILRNPAQLKLGGTKKYLTVLFADIRNFTGISEKLGPEGTTQLLKEFFTAMTDIILKNEGLLDKYIGDNLMAIFGAPVDKPHHPRLAAQAALEMIKTHQQLQQKWSSRGIRLEIGIGLHSGEMIVGNMGSEKIFDYTVIGDSVNLGSRLQDANKIYKTRIIISEQTRKELGSDLSCRELDLIRVRGRTQVTRIFELLGLTSELNQEYKNLIQNFERALSLYKERKWDRAGEDFRNLKTQSPHDGPTQVFLDRCELYLKNPPAENWDGATSLS